MKTEIHIRKCTLLWTIIQYGKKLASLFSLTVAGLVTGLIVSAAMLAQPWFLISAAISIKKIKV
jgi:putative effector of murein hydrolase LrgA (UPF0299 family)